MLMTFIYGPANQSSIFFFRAPIQVKENPGTICILGTDFIGRAWQITSRLFRLSQLTKRMAEPASGLGVEKVQTGI